MRKFTAVAFSLITVFSMSFFSFQRENYKPGRRIGPEPGRNQTVCANNAVTVQSASIDGDHRIALQSVL